MQLSSIIRKFIAEGLRFFFHHLYHRFAWSYNSIAWIVSLGQWNDWVLSVFDYLDSSGDGVILELGHGPGILLAQASQRGINIIGLDESEWMSKQATNNLVQKNLTPKLINGNAERLPIASGSINQVVSTFPSEYIYMDTTLKEIRRVLISSGSLIILPFAWIKGQRNVDRLGAWLFRITGQSPGLSATDVKQQIIKRMQLFGFRTKFKTIVRENSNVFIIIAQKKMY